MSLLTRRSLPGHYPPYEVFMANVEAEEEAELTIKVLSESYALTITNKYKVTGGL